MKSKKKKDTTQQQRSSTGETNEDKPRNPKPRSQGPKLTHLGVTRNKSTRNQSDSHHQQNNHQPRTTTAGSGVLSSLIGTSLESRSKRRPNTGDRDEPQTRSMEISTLHSSSSAAALAAGGEAAASMLSRVSGGENDSVYQQQQSTQLSVNTQPGGLFSRSETRLDNLPPDIVRTLTSLVMNRTNSTNQSQPRQSLLLGGASSFLGAQSELRFQRNPLHSTPAPSIPSALSYLQAQQSPLFGDITNPSQQSAAQAILQRELLSLIMNRGHQAPQTSSLNVPNTLWGQTRREQDSRFQLDALLQNAGSNTVTQPHRWLSDLAPNSIAATDSTATLTQGIAEGNRGLHLSHSTPEDGAENMQTGERKSGVLQQADTQASDRRVEDQGENLATPEHPGAITSKIVLPCGARGMPPEHNFQNAFLVIDTHTQHGDELICSYRPCRDGGVKFRYCSVCRLPVAKRNFHQRHSHGLATPTALPRNNKPLLPEVVGESTTGSRSESVSAGTSTNQQEEDTNATQTTNSIPSNEKQKQKGLVITQKKVSDAKQPSHQTKKTSKKQQLADSADDRKTFKMDALARTEEMAVDGIDSAAERSTLVREREWVSLLHRRPPSSDTAAISKWLFEVMSVSELPQPPLDTHTQERSPVSDQQLPEGGHGSGANKQEESMAAPMMVDRKARPRPMLDESPNDPESADAGEQESLSSVSDSSTGKQQSSNVEPHQHEDRRVSEGDGPRPRDKKRKR